MKSSKSPFVTRSRYMIISHPNYNPNTLGRADADQYIDAIRSGQQIVVILGFGQPCRTPNTLEQGAYSYDAQNVCHPASDFESDVKDYLDGFCTRMNEIQGGTAQQNCGAQYNPSAVPLILSFGPTNCGSLGCNPSLTPNSVNAANGQAWGTVVANVGSYAASSQYAYQVFITGALDIEADWNTYANTRAWIDGFKLGAPSKPLYSYGNCVCPDGYAPNGGFFINDWNYDRIHEVSFRATIGSDLIPQIYHESGIDARRWYGVSKWAIANGYGKITFDQLLTTYGRCLQGAPCTGIRNTAANAISQMFTVLDADLETRGGLPFSVRSTDIENYPFP